MRQQRTRFNLLFVAVFLVGMLISGVVARQTLREGARAETARNALLLLEAALAVRSYTIDETQPALADSKSSDFKPQAIPAYAAQQTLKRIQAKLPDYHYREAVQNPTNPADRSFEWEDGLISRFMADPELKEIVSETVSEMGWSMVVARPIRITNPACLSCHSTPEAAPAALLRRYGRTGGFGWQLGQVIGVQLIRVPMSAPLTHADQMLGIFMGMYVAIFGALLIALNLPIRRWMGELELRQTKLEAVQQQLEALNLELARQSMTDALTGLRNRRAFDVILREQCAVVERSHAPLGLLIFDVDQFKAYNDEFGHVAGDAALAQVGKILQANSRINDVAVRYGGEEFAVLLPGTALDAAVAVAERYRLAVQAGDWPLRPVSVSIGVAISHSAAQNASLVARADQALYAAKNQGRNRVVHLSPDQAPADGANLLLNLP